MPLLKMTNHRITVQLNKLVAGLFFVLIPFYTNSQGIFGNKSKKLEIKASYSYFKYDGDSVRCKRIALYNARTIIEIDQDQQYLLTKIENVESFLQQRRSGYQVDDMVFKTNLEAIKALERHYKIDLGLPDYENEFSFYKVHPIQTQEQISNEKMKRLNDQEEIESQEKEKKRMRLVEYNNKIQRQNDSIEIANKKRQIDEDSIDEVNYKIEIKKEQAEEKIRQKREAQEKAKREEQRKQELIRKHQELISKYGSGDGEMIFNKKVEVGWTKEKCLASWGNPREINRTTTANLKHEQWVYTLKRYLYFENGILTAIQD